MSERRRIVYLLLCFGFPDELRDLFRILYHPADHYIFHCDAKAPPALQALVRRLAASFPNVHCISPQLCSWGGYSLVDATFRGIDHALDALDDWSHLVLLSEQHLPLCSPDDIAGALVPGVSRFNVERVAVMDATRRDLIHQRFAWHYRELPGVGCFAVRRADLVRPFVERLHHGSQWMVLARDACERLRRRDEHPALMARMRASFIADETCIQTLLSGTPLGVGLKVRVASATYVAWPALNGRYDLIFTDDNFADASRQRYLFIRKRPRVLSATVQEVVERFAGLAPAAFEARLAPDEAAQARAPAADALATRLLAALAVLRPDIEVLPPPGGSAQVPRCFLRLRTPRMDQAVFLCVLSEDLRTFKVLLVWRRPGPKVDLPLTAGGYPTLLLGVRVAGVTHQREIHLPASTDQGFVTLDSDADVAPLVRMAAAYLAVGDAITFRAGPD